MTSCGSADSAATILLHFVIIAAKNPGRAHPYVCVCVCLCARAHAHVLSCGFWHHLLLLFSLLKTASVFQLQFWCSVTRTCLETCCTFITLWFTDSVCATFLTNQEERKSLIDYFTKNKALYFVAQPEKFHWKPSGKFNRKSQFLFIHRCYCTHHRIHCSPEDKISFLTWGKIKFELNFCVVGVSICWTAEECTLVNNRSVVL